MSSSGPRAEQKRQGLYLTCMQTVSRLRNARLAPPEPDPGSACRTSPANSRVRLKVSIAYGFDQLLCHFDNFLFAHCKVGRGHNNDSDSHEEPSTGFRVPRHGICGTLTLCTDDLPHPFVVPERERSLARFHTGDGGSLWGGGGECGVPELRKVNVVDGQTLGLVRSQVLTPK